MSDTFPLRYEGDGMFRAVPFMDRIKMVPSSTCWNWTGCLNNAGYGRIQHEGKLWYAHRFSYKIHIGEIPDGMSVLHKCDVPSCVNPDHLFLGTQADNVHDCLRKGRHRSGPVAGEKNGNAKLNTEQVAEIRAKADAGQTRKNIAEEYGVTPAHISHICLGKKWRAN